MRKWLLLLGLAVIVWPADALAGGRIALVIGNSQYDHAQMLPQPTKDADAMGELLKKAAFAVVTVHRDLGVTAMRRAVREFINLAPEADVAVLYYAGHGIEVGGSNYLIPVDATLASDLDVPDETISFDRLVRELGESGASLKRLRLVIVDACVENPFVRAMKITSPAENAARLPTRAGDRGSAQLRDGLLVAYAAKAGQTCDDHGDHSVFTSALLKSLTVPGLDIRLAFGRVRADVMKATDGKQEPFVYGALGGDALALMSGQAPPDQAQADYDVVRKIGTRKALEVFLQTYPTGIYSDLARLRLQGVTANGWRFVAPDFPTDARTCLLTCMDTWLHANPCSAAKDNVCMEMAVQSCSAQVARLVDHCRAGGSAD